MEFGFVFKAKAFNHKLAEKNWLRRIVKTGMVILTIYQAVVNTVSTELVISTNITIYGDFPASQIRLIEIAEIYLQLWENDSFTLRVFSEKWMPINILPDVKINAVKIYPLKSVDRQIVNEVFHKLHMQGRMDL